MNSETDEALMNKVKEGYLGSMSILFERYQTPLYNFFMRLTNDSEASQDLTQTAFYRAIKYKKSFDDRHSFRSWIYQLSRNLFYDNFRKSKRLKEHIVDDPDDSLEQFGASDESARERAKLELDDALQRLPDDQRELILMSKYHGLKYKEIGEAVGITAGAVKAKIHRAMLKLRTIYFEERAAR